MLGRVSWRRVTDVCKEIMRKIFGPTRTYDGCWRIKTNQEINDILKGQNIIGFIKKTKIKLVRPRR